MLNQNIKEGSLYPVDSNLHCMRNKYQMKTSHTFCRQVNILGMSFQLKSYFKDIKSHKFKNKYSKPKGIYQCKFLFVKQ